MPYVSFAMLLPLLLAPGVQASAPEDRPAHGGQDLALLVPPGQSQPAGSDAAAPAPGDSAATAPVVPPATAAGQPHMLRWAYMVGDQLPDAIRQHPDRLDILSPAWFHMDAAGNIYGKDVPSVTQFAKAHGIKVLPIVDNDHFAADSAHSVLADGTVQTNALNSLQWLVNNFGYDGLNIDWENMYSSDRTLLSAFMSNVYARIHSENGKLVTMALGAKTDEDPTGFAAPYDYAALAPHFDLAVIMAYDDHYAGGPAGAVAPLDWVGDVVNYATRLIPASKLLLGLPFYGYDWNITLGGWASAIGYSDIVSTVFAHGGTVYMDPFAHTPVYTYQAADGTHQIWFENSTSLSYKITLAQNKGLAGWGGWRIGLEDQNFWNVAGSSNAA
jgi:spore germination protein